MSNLVDALFLIPHEFWIGFFFVLGAIFGSFGNVLILRVPEGKSIVKPASECMTCKTPVKWHDNIPILSWFFLRGKCRSCKTPYSFRYPLVELLTAVLFAYTFHRFGFTFTTLEYLIFLFPLVVVTFIDFDHFLLPDIFTLSGIVIGLLGAALNPEREFLPAALGVFFGGGFLWALAYFYFLLRKEEGLGGGDIKLLAWIGALLGWEALPFVIIASSVSGSLVGIVIAYRQKKGMKTMIPFGPYLAFGAVLYMFAGESLAQTHLGWFFPSAQP